MTKSTSNQMQKTLYNNSSSLNTLSKNSNQTDPMKLNLQQVEKDNDENNINNELATQTPINWQQDQEHEDDILQQTEEDDSLNFTLQSGNQSQSILNLQSKPTMKHMITIKDEREAKQNQKAITQNILDFSKNNNEGIFKANQDIKHTLKNQESENIKKVHSIVQQEMQNQYQEALEGLAKIENYTAKYQKVKEKPDIPMGGDDKKAQRKIRKTIELMSKEHLSREWSNDGRIGDEKKKQFHTPSKTAEQRIDMLSSIKKDNYLAFSNNRSMKKQSNSKDSSKRDISFLSQSSHIQNQLYQTLQNQPLQLPDLSSKAQSQKKHKAPMIRDINYINVFIQPHQESLNQIDEEKLQAKYNSMEDNSEQKTNEFDLGFILEILKNSPLYEQIRKIQSQKIRTPNDSQQNSPKLNSQFHNQNNPAEHFNKLFSNQQTKSFIQEDVRLQSSILNQILDQILSGKFYYNSTKMLEKMQSEDLKTGKTTKYLKGIDFKQILLEQAKVTTNEKKQEGAEVVGTEMLPIDIEILDEIFSVKKIKEFEKNIESALFEADDDNKIITFLTQEYFPTKLMKSNSIDIDEKQSGYQTIKSLTQKQSEENDLREKHKTIVIKNAQQRAKMIQNIMNKIGKVNQELVNIQDQKQATGAGQTSTKHLIYLQNKLILQYSCFLELVRQIGFKCKEQSLLLIKIWHSYFDQKEQKDLKLVDLKLNYEKTQHILNIATMLLHSEEDKFNNGRERYDELCNNLKILMPRKIDPYEEDIILDVNRVLNGLQTKNIQSIKIDLLNSQLNKLQSDLDTLNHDKFTLKVDYDNYIINNKAELAKIREENYSLAQIIDDLKVNLKKKEEELKIYKHISVVVKTEQEVQTIISMNEMQKNNTQLARHVKSNSSSNNLDKMAKMKTMVATKDILEAFKAQPPIEKVYTPIKQFIKQVRNGNSIYHSEVRSLKKTLIIISNIIQAKVSAMEKNNDKYSLMNIDHYYYEYMIQRFGLESLSKKYCEIYLLSFQKYREADSRIELFRKFVGLDRDKLPYSIFVQYVQLIKAANYSIQALFTNNIQNLYIEFNSAKQSITNLVSDASPYIHNMIQTSLKKFTKVFSDNKRLVQGVDITDYQVFKEFLDKIYQSKYKNIVDFCNPLYQTYGSLTAEILKNNILKTFDFSHYDNPNSQIRIRDMIKIFFVEAVDANPQNILRENLMQSVRIKFEMKLPVSAYFHIGLNAVIENENNQNIWLENIYQFYSTIETDLVQIELGQHIRQTYAINGLEFEQFLYFLSDCQSKLNQNQIIEIYRNTCEQNSRILMACDDFIEACSKFKLIHNKKIFEENKKQRETKLKKLTGTQESKSSSRGQETRDNKPNLPYPKITDKGTPDKISQASSQGELKQSNSAKMMRSNSKRTLMNKKISSQIIQESSNGPEMPYHQKAPSSQSQLKLTKLSMSDKGRPNIDQKSQNQDLFASDSANNEEIKSQDYNGEIQKINQELNQKEKIKQPPKTNQRLFQSIHEPNNNYSVMKPEESFYTQKQNQRSSSNKSKIYQKTNFSKISMEVLSRDEDLIDDDNDDSSEEELIRLRTGGSKDRINSSNDQKSKTIYSDRAKQQVDSVGQQRMKNFFNGAQNTAFENQKIAQQAKNISDNNIQLEPILEEKYARTETYSNKQNNSVGDSDKQQVISQLSSNNQQELVPKPPRSNKSGKIQSNDSNKVFLITDQGQQIRSPMPEETKLLSNIEMVQQNLNERRLELFGSKNKDEKIFNWKDGISQSFQNPKKSIDQLDEKSHDSTLDMVLDREESSNTPKVQSRQRRGKTDKYSSKIPSTSIQAQPLQDSRGHEYSASEQSRYEHSPLIHQRQYGQQSSMNKSGSKFLNSEFYAKESLTYTDDNSEEDKEKSNYQLKF